MQRAEVEKLGRTKRCRGKDTHPNEFFVGESDVSKRSSFTICLRVSCSNAEMYFRVMRRCSLICNVLYMTNDPHQMETSTKLEGSLQSGGAVPSQHHRM